MGTSCSAGFARTRRQTSNPSTSPRSTSRMIRSGISRRIASYASAGSQQLAVRNPAARSTPSVARALTGSSSITSTREGTSSSNSRVPAASGRNAGMMTPSAGVGVSSTSSTPERPSANRRMARRESGPPRASSSSAASSQAPASRARAGCPTVPALPARRWKKFRSSRTAPGSPLAWAARACASRSCTRESCISRRKTTWSSRGSKGSDIPVESYRHDRYFPSAMIEVERLHKSYFVHRREPGLRAALRSLWHRPREEVKAVDGVSFRVGAAERVGFLGPNGAGKTTTLKVLSGLLHPTSGHVSVAGHTPQDRSREFLQQITLVMGQKQQLLWDLPPSETFLLNRAIYDIPRPQYDETLAELTDLLGLRGLLDKPTRQLSLGERMKCELAVALLHRPRILFLDEPTIGLDVTMQATVHGFVRAYNERFGATVLLTSHYMDDVAALCPRVLVIDHGHLIYDGSLDELVRRVRPDKRVLLKLSRPVDARDLTKIGGIVSHTDAQAVLQVSQLELQTAVQRALAQLPIVDLTIEDPPLEEVMRELFERGVSEGAA